MTGEVGGARLRERVEHRAPTAPTTTPRAKENDMPDSTDLLNLIREGMPAQDIIAYMGTYPCRLKRMLAGKRLRKALKLEAQLAAAAVKHRTATGVQHMAGRLDQLADSEKDETARKVCAQRLDDGLEQARRPDTQPLGLTFEDMVKLGKLPGHALLYQRDLTGEEQQEVIASALAKSQKAEESKAKLQVP